MSKSMKSKKGGGKKNYANMSDHDSDMNGNDRFGGQSNDKGKDKDGKQSNTIIQ